MMKRTHIPHGLLVLLTLVTSGTPLCAGAPKLTDEQRQKHVAAFEQVWTTVRDKHYDAKLNGLDWQAVRRELLPKVEAAQSAAEVRAVLKTMIDKLGESHFNIVPGETYTAIKGGGASVGSGSPGFDVRIVESQALVWHVDEDSAAAKAGVRPGWLLLKAGDTALAPILEKVAKAYKTSPKLQREEWVAVQTRLRGNPGDKRVCVFRDGQDKEVTHALPLVKPRGVEAKFGHMPPYYVYFESRKLPQNVHYFHLNAFFDPPNIMPAFEKAIQDSKHAKGFIIDVRGNPGGIGIMAAGFGSWFVKKEELKLGTMLLRDGKLNFILNRRPQTFDGPLAILVDGLSGSTSEIFAGGMQDLKRARVFGSRTMGAALPSIFDKLPNGDGFQYAFANYISVGGERLEGRGVTPDEAVPLTRQALLAGRDPALDAALAWIQKQ